MDTVTCLRCGGLRAIAAKCRTCVSEYNRKRRSSPEFIARERQYQREYLARPEVKARRYVQTARETRPEVRAKHNEAERLRAASFAGKRCTFRNHIRRTFGLSVEDFARLFEAQDHCCAACRVKLDLNSRATNIDHCHRTNRVRGILCEHCNKALGHALDSPLILRQLADYLDKDSTSRLQSLITYLEETK